MQYDNFLKLTEKKPADKLLGIHLALWYVFNNNWEMAHKTVHKLNTQTACWFYAYLHCVEGDMSNADYWYGQAYMETTTIALETELRDIIKSVFI